jgi:hypothetical protein
MKRYLWIMLPVLAICVAVFVVIFFWQDAAPSTEGRLMSIESYVTQNISTLSPEKEVLGGTFYVTSIQVVPGAGSEGTGVVSYEDGHNAFTADFVYESNEQSGHTITKFTVRP